MVPILLLKIVFIFNYITMLVQVFISRRFDLYKVFDFLDFLPVFEVL